MTHAQYPPAGAPGHGSQHPTPPPPAWAQHHHAAPRPGSSLAIGLSVVALIGLVLGVSIPENDRVGWSDFPAWAAFGVLAAIVMLIGPLVAAHLARPLRVIGAVGVVAFWVLIGMPMVSSNTGFCMAVGGLCAAAVLYLETAPSR